MNQPHDPNRTADIPSAPTNSLHADDTPRITDHGHGSASTNGSHPGVVAPGSDLPEVPGYRVVGEIARGGMGRVLAAFDLTLDRDVALKVLLPGAKSDRFLRESKITARLPHPGIPPVHALGTLADGSPFLAMKLIAGQTLAEEMKTADRPLLLQAFTQVCQAVGFAHSRGIIHRDLKPANVMVGAFGEVQVMDWGLAKDLTSREVAAEPRSSEIQTVPGDVMDPNQTSDLPDLGESTDDRTQAGQVMGTPAYMAPEQARGETTDARSDVFALGGILCKILTGHPPFSGKSTIEVIQRAAAADLAEANACLDACNADAELVALCRACLSPIPTDRPVDGQAVADRLTAYLNGVQERLQAVERERAVATAKAIEERRRRKVKVRAATLVLLFLVAGVIGTTLGMFEAKRQEKSAVEGWGRADVEQQRAEQRLATARDLIMNMGNFIEQLETGQKDPKLADLMRRQALDAARGLFDQFRVSQPEDERVHFQAAALHRYSANVSRLLSDFEAANDAYALSIRIMEDLTAQSPDSIVYSSRLAETLVDRAQLEKQRGKLKDSAATLDRALKLAEQLPVKASSTDSGMKVFDPKADPEVQRPVQTFNRTMGWIELHRAENAYYLGQFEDSVQSAARARELLDSLKKADLILQNSNDSLLAVMAVNWVAFNRRELGQTAEALAAHDEAIARMKALAGPKANRDELGWLCQVRRERARTAAVTTERRAADANDLIEISRIEQKLVDDNPQIAFLRERLATTHLVRGELLALLGQMEQANAELTKSLTVSRELIDRFGVRSQAMLVRGQTFLALGRMMAATGKNDEAVDNWKKAAKVFELALKVDPDNFHHRRGLTEAERALKPPAK